MLASRTLLHLSFLSRSGSVPAAASTRLQITPRGNPRWHLPCLLNTRPIFDTAQSRGFPVVLISGFLGAGKTTVLQQLLRQYHGFKLGVIVNDLASVNVDANVLRDAISTSGTKSVSLENGCVCCTAADDLRESVQGLLADSQGLDAVVVELSGVAEPARVKQILEEAGTGAELSVRTVTVVDSPAFATDYLQKQSPHSHEIHVGGECDDRFGTLLAEQVESANLLLLNKADMANDLELEQTRALLNVLNKAATKYTTEYGKVRVDELLALQPEMATGTPDAEATWCAEPIAAPQEEMTSLPACCAKRTCSSTNATSKNECESKETRSRAESRFGITSFVYRSEHLMSRAKLAKQITEWQKARDNLGKKLDLLGLSHDSMQASKHEVKAAAGGRATEASPLAPVLRSKGVVYLDANPEVPFYWSHAGHCINFAPWPENVAKAEGNSDSQKTELVFIGVGYDEAAIRRLLDSCLLSAEDIAFMKRMRSSA